MNTVLPLYFGHGDLLIPNICGFGEVIHTNMACPQQPDVSRLLKARSAIGTALHMHQPNYPINMTYDSAQVTPLTEGPLRGGPIRSNIDWMKTHPGVGQCFMIDRIMQAYRRFSAEIIPQLVAEGHHPRIALEFTGSLLDGLYKSGEFEVLFRLRESLTDPRFEGTIELLGAPWGHAHAPSTRPDDYLLHLIAWQNHVAALFGLDVLAKVQVFSPSEMALPIHPDIAFHYINNLAFVGGGYRAIILQADTVETLDGRPISNPNIPHRLVVQASNGDQRELFAFLKTGGSVGALLGEMQHFHQGRAANTVRISTKGNFPEYGFQIHDGENCNTVQGLQFGTNYMDAVRKMEAMGIVCANPSEYLAMLSAGGVFLEDLPAIRPKGQGLIYENFRQGSGPAELAKALEKLEQKHPEFSLGGLSWTPNLDWMDPGKYGNILALMSKASDVFHTHIRMANVPPGDRHYRECLYFFLNGQTSCFRWWGEKNDWTVRGEAMLYHFIDLAKKHFPLNG